MKISINRNQVLIAIGLLSTEGPDIAAVAAWLPTLGIPHLTGLIHLLGTVSLMLGGLALAWPRIRGLLAAGGLATPPGAQAPWDPKLNPTVVPVPPVSLVPPATPPAPRGPISPSNLGVLVFLVSALLSGAAMAQAPAPRLIDPQLGFCVQSWNTCFQPAAALSVLQCNLKTGTCERVALMAGYGATWKGAPIDLGAAVYAGMGWSANSPNAVQGSLMFNVANLVAAGPGVQVYRDPTGGSLVWQALFSLAVNYNVGGSPGYVQSKATMASDEKAAAELDFYSRGLKDGEALGKIGAGK